MAVTNIYTRAGVAEATRIAQLVVSRELPAHVVSQAGVAEATNAARHLPAATRASRFRRDSRRRPPDEVPHGTTPRAARDLHEPAPRLDLLA